jgi:ABC-type spermidine/putrescine transport system permease subunit II
MASETAAIEVENLVRRFGDVEAFSRVYSSVKRGITPDINALSTLIVLVSIVGTSGVALLQRPRQPIF